MLKRYQNTLACPDCGRSWHFMSDGLMTGDPCPSNDCPSNAKTPMSIINEVCKDFDANGIFSVGAIGALKAMAHHWKDHLAEGHSPNIISEDIDEMARQLEVMRAEIMRRLQKDENPNLTPYRVTLHEEPGDKFQLVFDCQAEDADHATEQASLAYPGCEIINCTAFDDRSSDFVIRSPNESALGSDVAFARSEAIKAEYLVSGCQAYDVDEAVRKLMAECGELFEDNRAAWSFLMEETHEDNELDSFQEDVGCVIDCMLQDDARGQVIVFVREGSNLIPKVVSADMIDLKNLRQYEMILFDGGNSAGDTWKHVFFPKQHKDCFVDENPLPGQHTASCDMSVSLNGGETWQAVPEGVRIAYKNVMIDGEDGRGELHINATHEGLITDIWTHREPPMVSDAPYDHNIGTDSILIGDIVSRLVEENA